MTKGAYDLHVYGLSHINGGWLKYVNQSQISFKFSKSDFFLCAEDLYQIQKASLFTYFTNASVLFISLSTNFLGFLNIVFTWIFDIMVLQKSAKKPIFFLP